MIRLATLIIRSISMGSVFLLCPLAYSQQPLESEETEHLIVVVGAAGSQEYELEFEEWSRPWCELAKLRRWKLTLIGTNESSFDPTLTARDALQRTIGEHTSPTQRMWIVLLGHGTASKGTAKFNLVGPDVSAKELSDWLKSVSCQTVFVNCSSASAPFLTELGGKNRILLTATRAGSEINFSRFGKFLSRSVSDLSADIDHDQEVSLLEAFLAASSQTERFYKEDARLATEHALLDDNGDRAGITSDFYRGIRPTKSAAKGKNLDGATASRIILFSSPDAPRLSPELERERTEIEIRIDKLRESKATLPLDDYYTSLEELLLQLAAVYDRGS